jgi:hypothetical protein
LQAPYFFGIGTNSRFFLQAYRQVFFSCLFGGKILKFFGGNSMEDSSTIYAVDADFKVPRDGEVGYCPAKVSREAAIIEKWARLLNLTLLPF